MYVFSEFIPIVVRGLVVKKLSLDFTDQDYVLLSKNIQLMLSIGMYNFLFYLFKGAL